MKRGDRVNVDGSLWECILGGTNMCVFQKVVKIKAEPKFDFQKLSSKKENVYYLEFIHIDDIDNILLYLTEKEIRYSKSCLYYVLIKYCNLRLTDIANKLSVVKGGISNSVSIVGKRKSSIDKADDLANILGYWKYKQLNK